MDHNTLVSYFASKLPEGTPPAVAEALVAKFRAAEGRHGRALPLGYAHVMVLHYRADLVRAAEVAVRNEGRAVVAQARKIEAERRVAAFVQAAAELDALATGEVARRLTFKQGEALAMLRLLTIDGETVEAVGRRYALSDVAVYQRVSRIRVLLRPHTVALGMASLIEVVLDSRVCAKGGANGFRE